MMLELWNLKETGLGERLRSVTLRIEAGVTAVLGQSGAGKTSLLNLLVGFEKPDAGSMATEIDAGGHRIPLFWVPADGGLWPHLTVEEHLAAVIGDRRGTGDRGIERTLVDFDLADRRDSRPDTLSFGERARLSVARALVADAAVLVMDEPLVHVDPNRAGRYWQRIREHIVSGGRSLIFATHSPQAVLSEANRVVCLREGRVLYAGAVEALYWAAPSEEAAGCLGEVNWLEPEAVQVWLGRQENRTRCLRPEQIRVAFDKTSPLIVESSRFRGSVAELELRHEPTGAMRTFYHRPASNHLARGTRIVLNLNTEANGQ